MKNINRKQFIIFCIILLICTPFLIDLLNIYVGNPVSVEWSAGDFLTYYGSVLGSLITLAGVVITLKHQDRESLKNDLVKYKPILDLEDVIQRRTYFGGSREIIVRESQVYYIGKGEKEAQSRQQFDYINNEFQTFHIVIKNKGRGETTESFLDEISLGKDALKVAQNLYVGAEGKVSVGDILAKRTIDITVKLPTFLTISNNFKDKSFIISVQFSITYWDMFRKIHRKHCVTAQFNGYLQDSIELSNRFVQNDTVYRVYYEDFAFMQETKIIEQKI